MKHILPKSLIATAVVVAAWFSNGAAGGPGYCYDPAARDGYVCPACNCTGEEHVEKKDGSCRACGAELVARKDLTYVAILLHDGVELLDFTGPAEVFTRAGGFYVYTVSAAGRAVSSQGFLTVQPAYSMESCPWPDVLVIPGGRSTELTESKLSMQWIKTVSENADVVMSVCTGAFVLANAGLLDGREATTHPAGIEKLKRDAPRTQIHARTTFVDNGKVITTAGASSGMDGALRVVQRLQGDDAARKTAAFLEYESWSPDGGWVVSARK